ncbi:MAG: type I restriction-modification system subunit M N-terminal domain-containing protein [Bacteroidota bacterium]
MGNWFWKAASRIRGDVDAPKYKHHILPILFLKRLSETFPLEAEQG